MAEIFEPGHFNLGLALDYFLVAIDGLRQWDDDAILQELKRMEAEGLVSCSGAHYRSTFEGQVARERLFQGMGQRAACLVRQHDYDIEDLALAIVVAPQVSGQRHYAESYDTMRVYLHERTDDLEQALVGIVEKGYAREANFGQSRTYYPTGKGMRRYDEIVRERLGIAEQLSILDASSPPTEKADTKLSWQLDVAGVQHAGIRAVLQRTIIELSAAQVHGMHMAGVVLAGSIGEGLLYDGLLAERPRAMAAAAAPKGKGGVVKDLESGRWVLSDYINVAAELGMLAPTTVKMAHDVLREFRNMIHPKVQVDMNLRPDASELKASVVWLEAVARDLKKYQASKVP